MSGPTPPVNCAQRSTSRHHQAPRAVGRYRDGMRRLPSAGRLSFAGRAVDDGPFRAVPPWSRTWRRGHPERTAVCYGGRDPQLPAAGPDGQRHGDCRRRPRRGQGRPGGDPARSTAWRCRPPTWPMMKLGAVFVPLDPAWPAERLETTLRVLSPRLILCADPGPRARRSTPGPPGSRRTPSPRRRSRPRSRWVRPTCATGSSPRVRPASPSAR